MNAYMITFSKDSPRLNNYIKTRDSFLPYLKKFEAIDTINNYSDWKNHALNNNFCTTKYTSSETDSTPGKLGCNLSYLKLFSEIASSTPDHAWNLIIEDDIKIDENFEPFLQELLKTLSENDTEYVSIYGDPRTSEEQFSSKYHIKDNLYSMIPQYYTLGQLVKTSGIKKILSTLPIDENIDLWRNSNTELLSCTIAKNNCVSNLGASSQCSHSSSEHSEMGSLIWDSAQTKNPEQILFQMHIMWYESKMIKETLNSIQEAVSNSPVPVKIILGLNSQTYLESPETGVASEMFSEFTSHPLISHPYTSCHYIDDEMPFYNIGDWRREVYNPNALYTVWGESDCLLPVDYFKILHSLSSQLTGPHFITLASRKMWDSTWSHVEHPELRNLPLGPNRENIEELYANIPDSLSSEKQITQFQLNEFNNKFKPTAKIIPNHKVDGSLLAISNNFPTPFIGENVHFAREDTCFEMFCRAKGIPQYLIETRIKGHNYKHPLKRTNTSSSRSDSAYKSYEQKSVNEINLFLKELSQPTPPQDVKKKDLDLLEK